MLLYLQAGNPIISFCFLAYGVCIQTYWFSIKSRVNPFSKSRVNPFSKKNFGVGTKGLLSTWPKMGAGGAPLVPVGITNRDKRVASQRLFPATIDAGF
jgi:hypothetical protein